MSTFKVSVRLVDGGLSEFSCGPEVLRDLQMLQSRGLSGKELVQRLFTDDWGTPPLTVEITGKAPDGKIVHVRIPYT